MDHAADALGFDRAELRRRNLVRPDDMPWTTPTGMVYDSGEFEARMDQALDASHRKAFETRRTAAAQDGQLILLKMFAVIFHVFDVLAVYVSHFAD